MEGISVEAWGAGGAVVVLLVGLVLWKVLKMALKLVICVVAIALGAAGGLVYLRTHEPAPPAAATPTTPQSPRVPPVGRPTGAPLGPVKPQQ
jgi:hypothetical protein